MLVGSLTPAGAVESTRVPHDVLAGEYTLRFLEDPEIGFIDTLQVLKGDELVYEGLFEAYLHMVQEPPGSEFGVLPLGLDVDATGDGRPDFVLQSYSGGAHCCYYTLVLEREPELAVLAEFDGSNSPAVLRDIDGDAALEVQLNDWTFAYWKASFADSPAPEVILDLQDEVYAGAPALMRRPPPSPDALKSEIAALHGELARAKRPVPGLWARMLDYIYSGNAEIAFQLLDGAWPAELPGKASFLLQFGAQLSFSPYWDTVAELNGWTTSDF
jgi:hypothetical protein